MDRILYLSEELDFLLVGEMLSFASAAPICGREELLGTLALRTLQDVHPKGKV